MINPHQTLLAVLFITCLLNSVERSTADTTHSLQHLTNNKRGLKYEQCETKTYDALKATKFESRALGLEWVGTEDRFVFAVTQKSRLWRSTDGGSTFSDITDRLSSAIKSAEPVQVLQIIPSKSDPSKVIFLGTGTYIWSTSDYGETFTASKTPGEFKGMRAELRVHPFQDGWMLAFARRPDCQPSDDYQMMCPNDLFVTQNAFNGLTWTNVTANAKGQIAGFVDFDWAATLCKNNRCTSSQVLDTTILATMYRKDGDWDMAWDPDIAFVTSSDFFKTFKTVVQCGNQFELVGSAIYLAFANSCPTDIYGKSRKQDGQWPRGITLYTSMDFGASFTQACLPVALKQEGYELLETHDGKGTVAIVDYVVKTQIGDLAASSVFTAGPHQALFSLSMSNVFRQENIGAATDFTRIEAVPGVFIANQLQPRHDDEEGIGQLVDQPLVVTRISFNGGGTWKPVRAPSRFNYQGCDRCNGQADCSLHLHGPSSWFYGAVQYPAIYSHPAAPGIIMASGNVGERGVGLDDNDGLCTWLSTDGGATWQDVGEGAFIYEYADWGGFIVMTRHELSGAADEIRFSWDYGRCWSTIPLDSAMLVDNIRIEPDGQRPKVLVHGRACRKSTNPKCSYKDDDQRSLPEGVLFALDLSAALGRGLYTCKPEVDYEYWSVPAAWGDPKQSTCLLGQQMQFTRRKQSAMCLQGGDYQRPPAANTTCECTPSDVECDFGYYADGQSCKPLPAERLPVCPTLYENGGVYSVSDSGRRLVHGDVCTGVDKIIMDTDGKGNCIHCTQKRRSGGGHHPFLWTLLVLALLCGAFFGWYRFLASETQKLTVQDLWESVTTFFSSLWEWLLEKVGLRRYHTLDANEELNYFQPLGDAGDTQAGNAGRFTL